MTDHQKNDFPGAQVPAGETPSQPAIEEAREMSPGQGAPEAAGEEALPSQQAEAAPQGEPPNRQNPRCPTRPSRNTPGRRLPSRRPRPSSLGRGASPAMEGPIRRPKGSGPKGTIPSSLGMGRLMDRRPPPMGRCGRPGKRCPGG